MASRASIPPPSSRVERTDVPRHVAEDGAGIARAAACLRAGEVIAFPTDTLYGLGAAVWTRDTHTAFRAGRAIQAGRVWTNCYHLYPAHAPFGGYKQSGIGRENHKMMLDHYQNVKNLLVSYDPKPMGFF